jgi:carbamoyltransferase
MISWGISANSHDAALAVYCDQHLVFASHSERFSGIKNDPHLSTKMLDYVRTQWGDPDKIYWYEKPLLKSFRQMFAGQGFTFSENNVKKYLQNYGISAPIKTTTHHKSHAAAGYYTSHFTDACVLVIDAIGEFQTLSIWEGEGNHLRKLYDVTYPHSIGLWYSAMTQRIGLKPNEEEYILMGMSAYGDPERFHDKILKDFIWFPDLLDDGNLIYFKDNLHRGCKHWMPELTSEQDYFDIAAGTQSVYETIFRRTLNYAAKMTGSKNLVFMGGCALNCVANPIAYDFFDNVYIMPNPGDAGSSIGAVLAHNPTWRQYQSQPFDPYLGYDMGHHTYNEKIVEYLIDQKICGIARGRAEFGPRALGNRSLIADPRDINIKDRVNEIKQRQKFRPFAPAVLSEYADEYFDIPGGSSPYMQMIAKCKRPDLFPAVVHKDGTSRVQTVDNDNSAFRQLLEIWHKHTGCPMLLNTSLNIKGEPMVNDHADAERFSQMYGLPVFN